ncbi:hypothetical protein PHJA_000298700, partial [Phtheirospermum japonicum]
DFRNAFIGTLQKLNNSPSRGVFVHSCYVHGHIGAREGWGCSSIVGNNTIREAISDWYFDRNPFQMIDTVNDVPRDCNSSTVPEVNGKCMRLMQ